jgi:hypothetical protein
MILKEVEGFFKWAERDGGYHKKACIPLYALYAGRTGQSIKQISKGMTDQLKHLALLHRQHLALATPATISGTDEVQIFRSQPPLLFGLLITHSVIVFVSHDASNADAKIRTIASFNFSDADMDVWNAFALGIFVITVRNRMVEALEGLGSDAEESESDPDA